MFMVKFLQSLQSLKPILTIADYPRPSRSCIVVKVVQKNVTKGILQKHFSLNNLKLVHIIAKAIYLKYPSMLLPDMLL